MLLNDPPTHTRLRRLVNAAFKPAVVQALRARVVAIAVQARGSSARFKRQLGCSTQKKVPPSVQ